MKNKEKENISRRTFISGAGALALGSVVSGSALAAGVAKVASTKTKAATLSKKQRIQSVLNKRLLTPSGRSLKISNYFDEVSMRVDIDSIVNDIVTSITVSRTQNQSDFSTEISAIEIQSFSLI